MLYLSHGNGIDGKHVCVYTHNRTVVYPTLHFRICVLSHEGVGTCGERNRTTLFTHELLSVRSIAHRNQQITAVSEKKKTVTTTSRCRFMMWSISPPVTKTPPATLHRFYNRRGEHEIPPRSADRPTRWFARFPTGAAGSKKSLSFLRRNDKAPICGSHARPCTAPCTHVDFSTLFRAIIRTALIAIADAGAHETPDCVDGDDRKFPFIVLPGWDSGSQRCMEKKYVTTAIIYCVLKKMFLFCNLRNRMRKSKIIIIDFQKILQKFVMVKFLMLQS